VARGCAELVEWLGQKENPNGKGWAVGADYGTKILTILNAIIAVKVETSKPESPPAPTFTPYLVKVTASELNIRKGAGTNFPVAGSIKDNGVYTIVEEANGEGAKKWGRLKSDAGWIALDFIKRA
jgi:uncharacterized protein YgiM (DUF1202 family)